MLERFPRGVRGRVFTCGIVSSLVLRFSVLPGYHRIMALFFGDKKAPASRIKRGDFTNREELQELFAELYKDEGLKIGDVAWALTDHRRDVRAMATKLIVAKRLPGTFPTVLKEAFSQSGAPQRMLLALLPKVGDAEGVKLLGKYLEGKHRAVAASALLQYPPGQIFNFLLGFLTDSDSELRYDALNKIASGVKEDAPLDPRIRNLILPLAGDSEEKVRMRAFELLARAPDEQFMELILDGIRKERYATKKRLVAILEATSVSANQRIIDKIVPLLSEGDDLIRNAALTIATRAGNPADVILKIIIYSKTLMGWMRDRIHQTMAKFGDKMLDPVLSLMEHEDPEVRSNALLFAANYNSPKLLEPCVRMLKEEDWWTRVVAIDLLGQLKDDRVVEPLIACLDDDDVRWSAVEALARIGSVKSVGHIAKLLNDPAPEIRVEVIRALEIFNDARSLPLLKKVYKEDEELGVREAALQAFKRVKVNNNIAVDDEEIRKEFGYEAKNAKPIDMLLLQTRKMGASDLHISTGQPPTVRRSGVLKKLGGTEYTAEQVDSFCADLLSEKQKALFEKDLQLDLSYEVQGAGRYRVNVFQHRLGPGAVFRVISNEIPSFETVGIPSHLGDVVNIHQGLIIVSGPAGSGKTTTLAALVDLFNEQKRAHVLTLEDPIEYVHPTKNSLISQREVGTHTEGFPAALRAALREDPDVIVVGEMRDTETMRLAISASETGHLVIATMHTTSSHKSISRLIESFAPREQGQIRMMLSESLKVILNQSLLPRKDGEGRVACFEALVNTGAVGNLIRDNKLGMIPSLMTIGFTKGMRTVDDALRGLLEQDLITGDVAYNKAMNKEDFESYVSEEYLEGLDG
jgi:twitching motility protein PilT